MERILAGSILLSSLTLRGLSVVRGVAGVGLGVGEHRLECCDQGCSVREAGENGTVPNRVFEHESWALRDLECIELGGRGACAGINLGGLS